MVLDIPRSILVAKNVTFAVVILHLPASAKARAAPALNLTAKVRLQLAKLPNRAMPQTQLTSLLRFAGGDRSDGITSLQHASVRHHPRAVLSSMGDVRGNAALLSSAVTDAREHLLPGVQLPNAEDQLLSTVTSPMNCTLKLVKVAVINAAFRSVLALSAIFVVAGHPFIFISNASEGRALVCRDLRQVLDRGRPTLTFGQLWQSSNILTYTTGEMNSDSDNSRRTMNLKSRYSDDFPHYS
jgi:hypothetical protein